MDSPFVLGRQAAGERRRGNDRSMCFGGQTPTERSSFAFSPKKALLCLPSLVNLWSSPCPLTTVLIQQLVYPLFINLLSAL